MYGPGLRLHWNMWRLLVLDSTTVSIKMYMCASDKFKPKNWNWIGDSWCLLLQSGYLTSFTLPKFLMFCQIYFFILWMWTSMSFWLVAKITNDFARFISRIGTKEKWHKKWPFGHNIIFLTKSLTCSTNIMLYVIIVYNNKLWWRWRLFSPVDG